MLGMYGQQGLSGQQLQNSVYSNNDLLNALQQQAPLQGKPKERTMFQEIKNDVSTFIKEHRGVIYFIALALLVDHFIFKGIFTARLQVMLESLIKKVEDKVAAS